MGVPAKGICCAFALAFAGCDQGPGRSPRDAYLVEVEAMRQLELSLAQALVAAQDATSKPLVRLAAEKRVEELKTAVAGQRLRVTKAENEL